MPEKNSGGLGARPPFTKNKSDQEGPGRSPPRSGDSKKVKLFYPHSGGFGKGQTRTVFGVILDTEGEVE